MSLADTLRLESSNAPRFTDHPEFMPYLHPQSILALGAFDGGYFNDEPDDIEFYVVAPSNLFAPNVGQSRAEWQEAGWIDPIDPLGWFQWYVRFTKGRRCHDDHRQIGRWASFVARHGAQIKKNGDGVGGNRLRQRQGLLHWAGNPLSDCE